MARKKAVGKHKQTKELGMYTIVGIATIFLNLGLFATLTLLGVDFRIANLIAIISSKIFGYVGNKKLVFCSQCENKKALMIEIGQFALVRSFTGLVDYFGLIFAVQLLGLNVVIAKCIIQAIVIVLNYLTGKFLIFKKKTDKKVSIDVEEENVMA